MIRSGKIIAMLGPTNTGKTHMAVERMLSFPTGMIGLPLRLLAREVYDRVAAAAGPGKTALVTGEEKIVPRGARYWICTVEAMPARQPVDFLAIDEAQLAADPERGHVFTDRILHARGARETWLLGAETIRPLLRKLLSDVEFRARPRFSRLTWAGAKKLTRLPPRTAVVAFSAAMVYSVAELLRRQKGGAAVVMGALSPRTRNAQVALYQSGDVEYLVATDAIGMGLNMDVDHVAFAATRKFDGFRHRDLTPAEMGQIAGRAGRHLNDGTFGVTARAAPLDAALIEDLEAHRFAPLKVLQWRNGNLNFASVDNLIASLRAPPNRQGLTRARPSADILALEALSRREDVMAMARDPRSVRLLWEVCQLPDYRNITGAEHAALVAAIFGFLRGPRGVIDEDWMARQVRRCARFDGDIDALSNRISHVRTWTFAANRADWLADPAHWREKTREIEDKLSDALHERLTRRFIDRKTSTLLRRLREREELMSSVDDEGAVRIEDEYAGRIEGFRFIPDGEKGDGAHRKAWAAAAREVIAKELAGRAQSAMAAPDTDFSLDEAGRIVWHGAPVARTRPGPDILKPDVELLADEALPAADREALSFRLRKFLGRHVEALLAPLIALRDDEDLTGAARGLAFRLIENLGVVPRPEVAEDVRGMDQDTRALLRRHGVRFGAFHIFLPALLKPAPTRLRILLWELARQARGAQAPERLPEPPGQGLTSVVADETWPEELYRICGYKLCGRRAVRVDMLERLGDMIRDRVFWKPRFDGEPRPQGSVEGGGFTVIPDMMSLIGCSGEDFAEVLRALGYQAEKRKAPPPPKPEKAEKAAGKGDEKPPAGEEAAAPDEAGEPEKGEKPKEDDPAEKNDPAGKGGEAPSTEAAPPAGEEAPAPAAGDENPADARQPPDAETEEEFFEVWWPRGAGPFRARGRGKKGGARKSAKPSRKPAPRKNAAGAARPRRAAPRREKPLDEDSPFAVLRKLKADMEKKS